MLAFQLTLILSGNLSFLNWLTIVPILACFDDGLLRRVLPRRLVRRAEQAAAAAVPSRAQGVATSRARGRRRGPQHRAHPEPALTGTAHEHVVRSPGAREHVRARSAPSAGCGRRSCSRGRAPRTPDDESEWRAYEFPLQARRRLAAPCVVAPYQYRLDWQIWFAAMSTAERYPWTLHLVWKLLHNDRGALGLLANDPFPGEPPRWIRARLYRYEFAAGDDPSGAWWKRTLVDEWLPPLSVDDPRLRRFLAAYGWAKIDAE
jgi:hypothetical protein